LWLTLFGFTFTFIGTSLGENEVGAAVKGGILFGTVAVVSGFGVWRLVKIGSGSSENTTTADSKG
jgi:hypothetical protein